MQRITITWTLAEDASFDDAVPAIVKTEVELNDSIIETFEGHKFNELDATDRTEDSVGRYLFAYLVTSDDN